MEILLDPLFRIPFAVGLVVSLVLPLAGTLLRLREEWLAALGLAHLAGATGLLGLAASIPAVLGAPLGAMAGALIKSSGRFSGNTVYAMMILAGWSITLLVAANTSLGSVMGHALFEGQLYFAGPLHLWAAIVLALAAAIVLPLSMARLIRARLQPTFELANPVPAWRWHLSFDLLAALGIAVGAGTLGLMGAFALAFVPPWVAFRLAGTWRQCLWISLLTGVTSYTTAFVVALIFDQPFGPVLVGVLLVLGSLAFVVVPGASALMQRTR
jgi:zinc/manganese transport system permease protein